MPLRSRTQSSLVSMIRDSMVLSTSSGGTAIPVPASTARASVVKGRVSFRWEGLVLPARQGDRLHPRDVADGQIAALYEAVDRVGPVAVEPRRRVRAVRPDLDAGVPGIGRDLEALLLRRAVEHVDDAAVGAVAEVAALAVEAVGGHRPLRVGVADAIAALAPEALGEGGGRRIVLEGQE